MLLAELVNLLDDLFLPGQFNDSCHNGLVIPGRKTVDRLLMGVSLNRALIERAAASRADALLVHHGVFLSGNWMVPEAIAPWVRTLIQHDLSLFCYHLPMDAHAEFSHNRYLMDRLGAENIEAFSPYGLIADLALPISLGEALQRLPVQDWAQGQPIRHFGISPRLQWNAGRWVCADGPDTIRKVAVASGRGGSEISAAAQAGAQLLISGEISEHIPEQAAILGINMIAMGHYLSEIGGVIRLGEWLKKVTRLELTIHLEDNPL